MQGEGQALPENDRPGASANDTGTAPSDFSALLNELKTKLLEVMFPDKDSIHELLFSADLDERYYPISGNSGSAALG